MSHCLRRARFLHRCSLSNAAPLSIVVFLDFCYPCACPTVVGEEAEMAYRKRKGKDTWHWCSNCGNWPTFDFEEKPAKPADGELCNECQAKEKAGTCKS